MITQEQECYLILIQNIKAYEVRGNWPEDFIIDLMKVNNVKSCTVVSLYSNTIKYLRLKEEIDWESPKVIYELEDIVPEKHFARGATEL